MYNLDFQPTTIDGFNKVELTTGSGDTEQGPIDMTGSGNSSLSKFIDVQSQIALHRMTLKGMLSAVAMHLTKEFRYDIYKQIDWLQDIDVDCDDEALIDTGSFESFAFFLSGFGSLKRPSLTVGPTGLIYANWNGEDGQLHIEFLRNRKYRLLISRGAVEEREYSTLIGNFGQVKVHLERVKLIVWIKNV